MLMPKYAENIIVAVEYKKICQWYITNKLIWILDYEKKYNILKDYYISIGRSLKRFNYEVGSINDFSKSRFGILILDESKANLLLSNIENYKVSTVELRNMYSLAYDKQIYLPSLYVNFDKRCLMSQFPELDKFEDFVPNGWKGYYKKFESLLNKKMIYWK